jgi:polyphosphate kinase
MPPRVFRHVALPAPSDREKTQVYIQRYFAHFPAAGEIILFDRSWYNRAGVERVMGFCSDKQYERFLALAPTFEREMIVYNDIILRKYFLDVSQDEQRRRFRARINDPVKHWKLSPMDTESVRRWWDYTAAYQRMIEATHTREAPWHIVPADDKRRARLNLIRHLLDSVPYKKVDIDLPKVPKAQPQPKGAAEGLSAVNSPGSVGLDSTVMPAVEEPLQAVQCLSSLIFVGGRRLSTRMQRLTRNTHNGKTTKL